MRAKDLLDKLGLRLEVREKPLVKYNTETKENEEVLDKKVAYVWIIFPNNKDLLMNYARIKDKENKELIEEIENQELSTFIYRINSSKFIENLI